ncbi:MAG: transglutaminase family protein [Deferrisomatales bacterium]|nr:transglutaminase family protein [Deferrisomatales bacterium]
MSTYRVVHTTRYDYEHPASLCHGEGRLVPRALPGQHLRRSELRVDPAPASLVERDDFFGNRALFFSVEGPHGSLEVTCTSEVEVAPQEPPLLEGSLAWEVARVSAWNGTDAPLIHARQFALESPAIPLSAELEAYARPSFPPARPLLAAVADLMGRIHTEFAYSPQSTTVATPVAEVLRQRRGVCQDFAHLALGCLRSLGLAARYVSGYLETLPPPGRERLVGADASHAWFAVCAPDSGWVDFDPTNNQIPRGRHVTVAWGRDYHDVAPLKGVVLGGGRHKVRVSVDVAPLDPAPAPPAGPTP